MELCKCTRSYHRPIRPINAYIIAYTDTPTGKKVLFSLWRLASLLKSGTAEYVLYQTLEELIHFIIRKWMANQNKQVLSPGIEISDFLFFLSQLKLLNVNNFVLHAYYAPIYYNNY